MEQWRGDEEPGWSGKNCLARQRGRAEDDAGLPEGANEAIHRLTGGGKVFAGQRDDPFFVARPGVRHDQPHGAGLGNKGGGVDDLAGYGVHSIVLQVPEKAVTRDGEAVASPGEKNAVVGVWSTTEPKQLGNGPRKRVGGDKAGLAPREPAGERGRRACREKDQFNRDEPERGRENYGPCVVEPELARMLNPLFRVNAPENNRMDIVQAVLQGVPGLNGKAGKNPTDTMKINLGVPPGATPNPIGALGRDTAGYPNGRRLEDDVIDIEIQVVAGALKGNKVPLGDGVNKNDVAFRNVVPVPRRSGPGGQPQGRLRLEAQGHRQWERDLDAPIDLRHRW